MTKAEYLKALQALYRVANMSDSDNPEKADWLDPEAATHQCRPMDKMLQSLLEWGSITQEDMQKFYDEL